MGAIMGAKWAVFLDRDGTIIEDHGHLGDVGEVRFIQRSVESLLRLQGQYLLFIVTNQSGIATGLVGAEQVRRVNDHVVEYLSRQGVDIAAVYTCPHQRSDGCECIKPNVHFLERAVREHNVDLGGSFVVGDHPHDYELAENGGCRGIYVLTGHGRKHFAELPEGATVAEDIEQACRMILEDEQIRGAGK